MSKLKRLAGETALYGLGSILPKALNFLLMPLHTIHLFRPEEYGVITNLMAYVAFLNILYTFGMETAYFRFATVDGADRKHVFNLTQTLVVSISLFFSTLFIVFSSSLAGSLHIGNHPEFIVWLALIMFLDGVVAIPFAELRLKGKPLQFAAAKILNILIIVGLNFYFLKISYDPAIGVGYVFLANLIGNISYLLFFLLPLVRWRPAYDRDISPKVFRYAYPVMLTGLAGMTNEMFSRLSLEWWLPSSPDGQRSESHALGVFGACYKYAALMNIAIQAFRYAAEPFFFSNAADRNSPELFARVNHYFVIVCCVLLLGVSLNLDIFKYFIGSEYWEGLHIVPVLLLGYLFLGMYYNFSVWFKVTDKTHVGTIITAGGAVLTILLNFLLVPYLGYTGSSYATLLVYLFMALLCYQLGQKYYPIPYRYRADICYLVATVVLIAAVSRFNIPNQWFSTGVHVMVVVGFIVGAYLIEAKWVIRAGEQSSGKQ